MRAAAQRRERVALGLILIATMATSAVACAITPGAPAVRPPAGTFEPGELLIEFREGTTAEQIKKVHEAVGATPVEEVVPLVWRAAVPQGAETDMIPRFKARPEVRFAEVNAKLHTNMIGSFRPAQSGAGAGARADSGRALQAKVTDPRFSTDKADLPGQWGLRRIGLCSGVGAATDCATWDATMGDGIKVAVIDTGVDLQHPDLRDNLLPGRNFLEGGSAEPTDDFGHGTHVAGIIGAGANGMGVVGIAPKAKIIPIRVLGVDGGNTLGLIQGLNYAVSSGARVINLSLGSAQTSAIEEGQMAKAIAANVVVVAAAGNEALGGNPLEYPAAIAGVISVAATRQASDDVDAKFSERAPFSNYNPFVSVAAPGVDILSTIPRRFIVTTGNPNDDGNAYAYASGTSMAAPIVTGVVALMLAANPGLKPAQIKQKLQGTATDLGDTGFDDFYGWGIVNVPTAVQ